MGFVVVSSSKQEERNEMSEGDHPEGNVFVKRTVADPGVREHGPGENGDCVGIHDDSADHTDEVVDGVDAGSDVLVQFFVDQVVNEGRENVGVCEKFDALDGVNDVN